MEESVTVATKSGSTSIIIFLSQGRDTVFVFLIRFSNEFGAVTEKHFFEQRVFFTF